MPMSVWFRYVFGQADAIRQVAASRAALWTGIALVLLTSIARSYDQTYFFEKPLLWVFGPLLFSLVSGSWIYAVVYVWFARRDMSAPGEPRPTEDGGWLSFMALFWMTAPIAWLYAIPVERLTDSIAATWMNVILLAVVSLWRVLLLTQVMHVTTKAPFGHALIWVGFAASVEVLVVFFFGDGFAKAIMRGMGGMRNSPEEDILYGAMSTAFTGAFWLAPISFVLALVLRPKRLLQPLPIPTKGSVRWPALLLVACSWIAIAIVPQRELANTVKVEQLLAAGRAREAIDFLASHKAGDFAPGRALPPKPFERSLFTELPDCLGVIQASDPAWVRALMLTRLDVMISHGGLRRIDTTEPKAKQVEQTISGLNRHGPDADGLMNVFRGLKELQEGGAWLKTNDVFLEAAWRLATEEESRRYRTSQSAESWLTLSNSLRELVPALPASTKHPAP